MKTASPAALLARFPQAVQEQAGDKDSPELALFQDLTTEGPRGPQTPRLSRQFRGRGLQLEPIRGRIEKIANEVK